MAAVPRGATSPTAGKDNLVYASPTQDDDDGLGSSGALVEPRTPVVLPLSSVVLEGHGLRRARVVVVAELEPATWAHLV